MITREELIDNPANWKSTEKLNLDAFDEISTKLGNTFFIRKKDSVQVYFGHYIPDEQSFKSHALGGHGKESWIKREDVSHFIALPPISFSKERSVIEFTKEELEEIRQMARFLGQTDSGSLMDFALKIFEKCNKMLEDYCEHDRYVEYTGEAEFPHYCSNCDAFIRFD